VKHNIGSRNPFAKLTELDVVELRAMRPRPRQRYPRGHPLSLAVLSQRYGVRPSQLSKAINGVAWRHLPLSHKAT
jgi:hypothetical protein